VSARNAVIYGGYALTVLIVQLALLAALDEEHVLPLLAPVCLVALPAGSTHLPGAEPAALRRARRVLPGPLTPSRSR